MQCNAIMSFKYLFIIRYYAL